MTLTVPPSGIPSGVISFQLVPLSFELRGHRLFSWMGSVLGNGPKWGDRGIRGRIVVRKGAGGVCAPSTCRAASSFYASPAASHRPSLEIPIIRPELSCRRLTRRAPQLKTRHKDKICNKRTVV